jgi:hypothetical protein
MATPSARAGPRQPQIDSCADVISMLEQKIPTEEELKRRREACGRLAELRAQPPLTPGPFPSAEEMIREDRER